MPGQLLGNRVIVQAQSEASRIHNKGNYGKPLSGGALELELFEAAHLVELDRLEVEDNGTPLTWADVVREASRLQHGFEILYLVYRDLRDRGYLVHSTGGREATEGAHFRTWPRGTDRPGLPTAWIRAVSERSPLALRDLTRFVQSAEKAACAPRYAVVDEESDLTYYDLSVEPPTGRVPPRPDAPVEGTLLADRVLVAGPAATKTLHGREFFGRTVADGLKISLVEACYLIEHGRLNVVDSRTRKPLSATAVRKRARDLEPTLDVRLRAFNDLKERGLVVKTGFKFGTHFRAYQTDVEEGHAPYLVQAVPASFESPWEPIARAVRLSHSVRKRFFLAGVPGTGAVQYLSFGRFKP